MAIVKYYDTTNNVWTTSEVAYITKSADEPRYARCEYIFKYRFVFTDDNHFAIDWIVQLHRKSDYYGNAYEYLNDTTYICVKKNDTEITKVTLGPSSGTVYGKDTVTMYSGIANIGNNGSGITVYGYFKATNFVSYTDQVYYSLHPVTFSEDYNVDTNVYTITTNLKGGTGNVETVYTPNTNITLNFQTPTKYGYSFEGWSTSSAATTVNYVNGNNIPVSSNITLYAVWKALLSDITSFSPDKLLIDSNITTVITQQGDTYDYNHTLLIEYNSIRYTIESNITSQTQTISKTFAIPNNLYNLIVTSITTALSVSLNIVLQTYYGQNLLGEKSYAKTIYLDSNNFKPTVTSITLSDYVTRPTGLTKYVLGKSKISANVVSDPKINASIVRYTYLVEGKSTTHSFETGNHTTDTYVSDVLRNGLQNTLQLNVYDSRGNSCLSSPTYQTIAYNNPVATNIVMSRCLQDGTISSQGTYLKVDFDYEITSLENCNSKKFTVTYKQYNQADTYYIDTETGTSTLTEHTLDTYTGHATYVSTNPIMTDAYTFDVRLNLMDFYETTNYYLLTVSTAFSIMDFKANKLGVAFGKVSEVDNCVEISGDWKLQIGDTSLTEQQLIDLLALLS